MAESLVRSKQMPRGPGRAAVQRGGADAVGPPTGATARGAPDEAGGLWSCARDPEDTSDKRGAGCCRPSLWYLQMCGC